MFLAYIIIGALTEDPGGSAVGPIFIIMDSAPQMASWVGAGKQLAIMSSLIGLTNMLPTPPLDGGQIIRNLIKRRPSKGLVPAYDKFGMLCVFCLIALALSRDIQKLIQLIF